MSGVGPIRTADRATIEAAASRLKAGGLVAFPTETVYGLGADAANGEAVAKIFAAKNRPGFNPLIVHVRDQSEAAEHVRFTPPAEKLAETFWPGPLTLVLERRDDCGFSDLVSAGLPTAAVRAPNHAIAQNLLRAAGFPIAAPSANRSESVSPTRAVHVRESLGTRAGMILDGGACALGLESTVVDASEYPVRLLRPGGIPIEKLRAICECADDTREQSDRPRSPGRMLRHYAPALPLRINCENPPKGWAYLGIGPDRDHPLTKNLSEGGNLNEAAANLFAMLRELDKGEFSGIAVAPIPREGLGAAINDRLSRARTEPRQKRSRSD